MKGVESKWSFSSFDNIVECLQNCDPDSIIFKKLQLKRKKVSYVISHGLGPCFREDLIRDLKKAPGFVLGGDSYTFKVNVDIVVRYWLSERNRVVDAFLDLHTFGREPAVNQVEAIIKTLENDNIPLTDLTMLSRDDPNLMRAVYSGLSDKAKLAGNPIVEDGPCVLHPVHTAFKKAIEKVHEETGVDPLSLVRKLFAWFKLSSARREDMAPIMEAVEGVVSFYLRRLVATRWLEAVPCL